MKLFGKKKAKEAEEKAPAAEGKAAEAAPGAAKGASKAAPKPKAKPKAEPKPPAPPKPPVWTGEKLKELAGKFTPRQRIYFAAGAAVLLAAVWFFVGLINKQGFSPLYTGLSNEDARALAQQLSAKGVSYQLTPDGTGISVPSDKLDALRMQLATDGPPQSGRLGFELFDKPNWMGSDFSEKVNYQRALEGELERTIKTIGSIDSVRVHLVMPRESLFSEQERQAKASVVVKMRSGKLEAEQATAIRNLVASAVDQLPVERVSIITADGNNPLAQPAKNAGKSHGLAGELETKLMATLTPIAGEGRIRASVFVENSTATSEKTQETYDPNTAVVLSSQESEEQRGRAVMTAVPGAASNVPAARPAESTTAAAGRIPESQSSRNATKSFAVNKTVEHISQPAGDVKHIATAVLVDDFTEVDSSKTPPVTKRRKRSEAEMAQVLLLAKAAVGYNEARGDQIAVQNISFEQPPVETPPPPTKVEQVLEVTQKWRETVRYGVLLLLFLMTYLIVLRPIKKQMVRTLQGAEPEDPETLDGEVVEAEAATAELPGGPAVALQNAASAAELAAVQASQDEAVSKQLKQILVERVTREPATASKLVQNWIRQDEVRK